MKNRFFWIIFGWAFVFAVFILGCQEERKETPTKGNLTVVVSESVFPVIKQEEQRFEDLYPDAHIELLAADAREAITRLFNDTIKMIVSSRPLNYEEREVAKRTKLELNEFKIAIDGIAIVVNNANPVMQLRTTQLDSIYKGTITKWNYVGGNRSSIEICLPNRNSGTFEVVGMKVLHGGNYTTPAKVVNNSVEMLQFISDHSNAIGMVGLNWLSEKKENVRIIELSDPNAPDSLGIRGQYFLPHQAHVHRGFYPLTRDVYVYSKADMYSVASGFISFITSAPGQQIILNNGLVPATMPVRLVQLTNRGI